MGSKFAFNYGTPRDRSVLGAWCALHHFVGVVGTSLRARAGSTNRLLPLVPRVANGDFTGSHVLPWRERRFTPL